MCVFRGKVEDVLIAESIFLCDDIVIKHDLGGFFYFADSTYSWYFKNQNSALANKSVAEKSRKPSPFHSTVGYHAWSSVIFPFLEK